MESKYINSSIGLNKTTQTLPSNACFSKWMHSHAWVPPLFSLQIPVAAGMSNLWNLETQPVLTGKDWQPGDGGRRETRACSGGDRTPTHQQPPGFLGPSWWLLGTSTSITTTYPLPNLSTGFQTQKAHI